MSVRTLDVGVDTLFAQELVFVGAAAHEEEPVVLGLQESPLPIYCFRQVPFCLSLQLLEHLNVPEMKAMCEP